MLTAVYRDFTSDVNLCVEIWGTEVISSSDTGDHFIMMVVKWGTALFVIIPYIANLIIAARIQKLIKTNEAAKAWYV